MKNLPWIVRGDFRRIEYSRHRTKEAAERAAKKLAKKWGWSHLGSEPIVCYEANQELAR